MKHFTAALQTFLNMDWSYFSLLLGFVLTNCTKCFSKLLCPFVVLPARKATCCFTWSIRMLDWRTFSPTDSTKNIYPVLQGENFFIILVLNTKLNIARMYNCRTSFCNSFVKLSSLWVLICSVRSRTKVE